VPTPSRTPAGTASAGTRPEASVHVGQRPEVVDGEEESSKNTDNWVVSLQKRTADTLSRWIEERDQYENYSNTDALWLTRNGNAYSSSALKHVLLRLCEESAIKTENRTVTWYSIRHSVVSTRMTALLSGVAKQSPVARRTSHRSRCGKD
jgi:integrase